MRFPIEEYLTPRQPLTAVAKQNETTIKIKLLRGVPHQVKLINNINLVVVVPSGNATLWRDANPVEILSSSAAERLPALLNNASYTSDFDRVPARLMVRNGQKILTALPLTTGLVAEVNTDDSIGNLLLQITIINWQITFGNLRGPGDFGGSLSLSWCTTHAGSAHYSTPPVNPYLIPRLQPAYKMESALGIKLPKAMARFSARQQQMKVVHLS